MICFFYVTQNMTLSQKENGVVYDHAFENSFIDDTLFFDKTYFTTPSNFFAHYNTLKNKLGDKAEGLMVPIDQSFISSVEGFPTHIGFDNLELQLRKFKGKQEVKIAILNGMSNAIGDHLIGMQAFDHWYKTVTELLPESKIIISFFQLTPQKLAPITRQWADKIDHLYVLPSNTHRLMDQDAFVDLGGLLARDGFNTEHMFDFYLKALSLDPKRFDDSTKRIKYQLPEQPLKQIQQVMDAIRSKGRPILLFHHTSTTAFRQMDKERSKKFVAEIIEKSEYLVVSADGLDYQNERFIDISRFSISLDHFASIISEVDAIITVDTLTYHLADAFNTPTVVLFTSVDPNLRAKYYPHVEGIMYEEKDGPLYGLHNKHFITEEDLKHLDQLWDKLDVDEILQKLDLCKNSTLH